MRTPGPGSGFGAPGVDPATAAKPTANQVDRGRSKDRSFDDQLGDWLAAAADDEDPDTAPVNAAAVQASGAEAQEKAPGQSAIPTAAGGTAIPSAEGESSIPSPVADEASMTFGPGIGEPGGVEAAHKAAVASSTTAAGVGPGAPAAVRTLPGASAMPGQHCGPGTAASETSMAAAGEDGSQGEASPIATGVEATRGQQVSSAPSTQHSEEVVRSGAVPGRQPVQARETGPHPPAVPVKDVEAAAPPEPAMEATLPKFDPVKDPALPGTDPGPASAARSGGQRSFDTSTEGESDDPNRSFAHTPAPFEADAAREGLKAALPELHLPSAPQPAGASADAAVRLSVPTSLGGLQVTQIPGFEVAVPVQGPGSPLPAETTSSIIQSLRMQYQQGGGDAVVHIKPEHLGPVSVSLRVENGVVSAVVTAENPAVAEWLKANEHVLRDGLSSSGLHLERFAVRRDGQSPDDAHKGYRPPEPKERRRRLLQPESTFEITV